MERSHYQIVWLLSQGGLGRKVEELLSQPASPTPGNPLGALTFSQTERIWREEVEPLLPEFSSMNMFPGQERTDPTSPWAANELSHLED